MSKLINTVKSKQPLYINDNTKANLCEALDITTWESV